MIEHLYTMTHNFISLKTSSLCCYKTHLPKIYFSYFTWGFFKDLPFDYEFESTERFRFFNFIRY